MTPLPIRPTKTAQTTRVTRYAYRGERPDYADMSNPLEAFFWSHEGDIINKWHHYFAIYHRYLQAYRGKPIKVLEIGVSEGGSLEMWRQYFGPEATLFGIDIDPVCARYDGLHGEVRIGSQDDPAFLAKVVDEMGGVDVVIDDGSHNSNHIRTSFTALFPRLSVGGIYLVEDLHAAYWDAFSGGYDVETSFMRDVKQMIDDIHHWYHAGGQGVSVLAGELGGVHVHDSIVVLEKTSARRPAHTKRGRRGGAAAKPSPQLSDKVE